MLNSEEIKPIALSIVELDYAWLEASVSQQKFLLNRNFLKIPQKLIGKGLGLV